MLTLAIMSTYNDFSAFCGYDLQDNITLQYTTYLPSRQTCNVNAESNLNEIS